MTLGWTGQLAETRGGTNQSTYTLGDMLYASAANTLSKLAGNITTTKQYLSQTGGGATSNAPVWATISGVDITGAALTTGNDTNVTLTLGGTPTTALLRAASVTAGWTGQLSLTRGGTNASLTASNGGVVWSNATQLQILSGTATANQILLSGSTATPAWSTATYPATAGASGNVLTSDGTNWSSQAPAITTVLTTKGDILTFTTVDARLAIGSTNGQVLQVASGAATGNAWSTAAYPTVATSTGTILRADGTNWVASTSTYPNTNAANTLLYASASNVMSALATANDGLLVTGNTGVPSILAGPGTTGNMLLSNAAAAPSFSTSTIPTSAGATAGKALVSDGTNYVLSTPTFPNASAASGKIIISDGTNWIASTPTYPATAGTSGNVLTSDGTNWLSSTPSSTALLTTKGDLFSFSTVDARLPVGTINGQVLQVNSAAATGLSYSTPTYPSASGTAGQLLRSDGTNNLYSTSTYPNTNAVSTLLYASATNVMSALTTANGGVLVTSNTGVPSILAGSGTSGQVLQAVSGAAPAWSTPTYPSTSGSTGVILRSDGTNYVATTSTYPNTNAVNTLLYASSANVMSALATVTTAVLTTSAGVPTWAASLSVALGGNGVTSRPTASYATGGTTSLAANGFTKVSFASSNWDLGSYMSSSRYTPLVAGTYQVNANMNLSSSQLLTAYLCCLYKNGSVYKYGQLLECTVANQISSLLSCLVQLNGSTDYIEIFGYNGHATLTAQVSGTSYASYFDIIWVGPSS